MALIDKIKPAFWQVRPHLPGSSHYLFNYRRIWKLSVLLTGIVALVPLVIITLLDYRVTAHSLESEYRLNTARVVSNTRRTIGFFLSERRSALEFIINENTPEVLTDPARLAVVLESLRKSFGGGFIDLGIIDAQGKQETYVGPYQLAHKNYHDQEWFRQVVESGVYISDVFLGYRQVPHLVIAIKQPMPAGSFHVLRASIGIGPFETLLAELELGGLGDAFIVNRHGILQTGSRNHGAVLEKVTLPIPLNHAETEVIDVEDSDGEPLLMGFRFIENTPFILIIVKKKLDLMRSWHSTRLRLILFLVVSITLIAVVILGTATYMVHHMHLADEKRLMSLHQVEYANKMASIGRMAASIAHEINNPLAIINEKAGLIKDLFVLKKQYTADAKLIGLVDSVLASVRRAGKITKRLLTFARNLEASIEKISIGEVIEEVLSFVEKEAALRNITITTELSGVTPEIESDRGKLQQIFLNIINNALAAVADGGHLTIGAEPQGTQGVRLKFSDNGCGIPPEDLHRIFEPFFTTKSGQGGTGLGLSITYNLVQEIGGTINVRSEVGIGTSFTIILPLRPEKMEEAANARIIGG